ncbi:MAG TPA: MCE family protein, partial [Actinomycetota bacterium]|nr:MCE family protein [Actinomycetota bacterium]
KVGHVTGIELTPRSARIEMEIEKDVRLPRETRLEVKLKTILGQKFVDLQFPKGYIEAASGGNDPSDATAGYLAEGAVIPREQTKVPFEIYQAANEGTDVLSGIDKHALRRLLVLLSGTADRSKQELAYALTSLNRAAGVLAPKSEAISALLRNSRKVTATLAGSDSNIEGILDRASNVLGTLAERRQTITSLLAATNDLALNLGLLIKDARGSIHLGVSDLNGILTTVESESASIDRALAQFGVAQEMFGRPVTFGRFTEGHACAITTEDTCVPSGSPADPGFPVKGTQPLRAGGPR